MQATVEVGGKRRTRETDPYFDQALAVVLSAGIRQPYRDSPTGTGFPTTYEVDYVRVWQLPPG